MHKSAEFFVFVFLQEKSVFCSGHRMTFNYNLVESLHSLPMSQLGTVSVLSCVAI